MFDLQTTRKLYRKMLTLYPQVFREQLGESMAQSFNDLANERERQTGRLFGLVL